MNSSYRMDMHTHTIASGHAYNTVNEMIRAAADKGLELLGISEHGPAMPGSTNKFYFQNLNIMSRKKYGVHVLYGAEFNLINLKGNMDLDERSWRDLDYAIASLHHNCITPGSRKENTYALLTAMEHPKVSIIGHPDDGHFPLYYEELVREAKRQHILIELNNSSFNPKGFRIHAYENNLEILRLCAAYEVPILLSSDAHREEDVGEFAQAEALLEQVDFPGQLVVNTSLSRIRGWIPDFNPDK